ncbi:MAG: hypothetical protein KatS3mg087_0618 [Patescibacteria group bacterium]|nr:MAG: hypothetical protein KatS3mg087_0618 [Patescibacteria group bacterium]
MLPAWEWRSLIKRHFQLEAQATLNQISAVSAGFGGGESAEKLVERLQRIAFNQKEPDAMDLNVFNEVGIIALGE